jgi:hypothetical protein
MKKLLGLLFGAIWLPFTGFSQGVHPYQHHNERAKDSVEARNLQQFFRNGTLYGHGRYFFMATDNQQGLTDHFAHAAGMGIAYETAPLYGFQMGLSGFFNYNLGSSDLGLADGITGQSSRYEVGLFDIERPHERADMDRLEDLYLKYTRGKSVFVFGKQHVKTAFINPQDGRMRPTLVDGLQFQFREWTRFQLQGGLLYGISPRSTVKWYGIGESMGVYPSGLNVSGQRSTHAGQIEAEYLAFLEGQYKIKPHWQLQFSNLYVDRLMNTLLLQTDYHRAFDGFKLRLGAQGIWQRGTPGRDGVTHDYLTAGHQAWVYGGRFGIDLPSKWQITLNMSRIADADRYLMPREWGRDPMFTFLPRERNEGFADVRAVNLVVRKPVGSRWLLSSGTGYYQMPLPTDFARNKYGLPSYYQVNLDAFYTFGGWMEGFTGQLLYVYKGDASAGPLREGHTINRVNMSLWNLVLNYHF